MRRAEWRRRADDPTGPLGWWWRGFLEGGWPPFLLSGALFGYALFSGTVWWAVPALLLPAGGSFLRVFSASDRLRSLLPDTPPPGQFRASVAYRRRGIVTGRDEMALTVVGGWLFGEGVRSHFALRPEDVAFVKASAGGRMWMPLDDGSDLALCCLDCEGTLDRW